MRKPTLPFLVSWALLLALFTAVDAFGEEPVELSETQRHLNERAVQAMINGDFDTAVKLLRASPETGQVNHPYLNLGRA